VNKITVLLPTSPIQAHPDTSFIDETIQTIRHHLPTAEIILTIDGVRPEQEHYRERYELYVQKLLWSCLHKYKNVLPLAFEDHRHQSGMLKLALHEVRTPYIMYVEHDAPLTPDREIDWGKIIQFLDSGEATTVRLHHENVIPKEHDYLMLGEQDGFMRTYQWSQRPHVSSAIYYRDIVLPSFPDSARTMIEDKFHGVVMNDYFDYKMQGWYKHRLWIYYPKNGIQRSYHLDTRGSDPKYEMRYE